MVLAAFGGGAVVRRVVGVGAQGGAWAPVIDVSELPARLPSSEFPSRPSSLGAVRAVVPPSGSIVG